MDQQVTGTPVDRTALAAMAGEQVAMVLAAAEHAAGEIRMRAQRELLAVYQAQKDLVRKLTLIRDALNGVLGELAPAAALEQAPPAPPGPPAPSEVLIRAAQEAEVQAVSAPPPAASVPAPEEPPSPREAVMAAAAGQQAQGISSGGEDDPMAALRLMSRG